MFRTTRPASAVAAWRHSFAGRELPANARHARRAWRAGVLAFIRRITHWLRRRPGLAWLLALRVRAYLTNLHFRPPVSRRCWPDAPMLTRELYAAAGVGPCWPDLRAGGGALLMPP